MLPFSPEPMQTLRARYAAALEKVYDHAVADSFGDNRPGTHHRHVFDFVDGVRLIISRERFRDGLVGVHVSASAQPDTEAYAAVRSGRYLPSDFCDVVIYRWQQLARSDRRPTLLGLTDGKGIPHFFLQDAA